MTRRDDTADAVAWLEDGDNWRGRQRDGLHAQHQQNWNSGVSQQISGPMISLKDGLPKGRCTICDGPG